jgi:hypothetical protein
VQDRVLELLGQKTLDVAALQQAGPWQRFAAATDEAARELTEFCHRPVRFVHPWGVNPADPGHRAFVETLAGGNDFDLDVLLTLLPASSPPTALVGDVEAGISLLRELSREELAAFARRFQIARPPDDLRADLLSYQQTARIRALDGFLQMTTQHLEAAGMRVRRPPLLLVPTRLIGHQKFAADQPHLHFPLGFANVVLETTHADGPCAEGFGSGLPTLDGAARAIFSEAGYQLTLYPPLVESLIGEGGYRCATQEIRAAAR